MNYICSNKYYKTLINDIKRHNNEEFVYIVDKYNININNIKNKLFNKCIIYNNIEIFEELIYYYNLIPQKEILEKAICNKRIKIIEIILKNRKINICNDNIKILIKYNDIVCKLLNNPRFNPCIQNNKLIITYLQKLIKNKNCENKYLNIINKIIDHPKFKPICIEDIYKLAKINNNKKLVMKIYKRYFFIR